jgi:hypothetical protein
MTAFNWKCPHCRHAVTITPARRSSNSHYLSISNATGPLELATEFFVCPNPDCEKFTLMANLRRGDRVGTAMKFTHSIGHWRLVPQSSARVFPEYVPEAIRDDYVEACQIQNLSPKASATLSRRCLQGMIRDFWGVRPGRLFDEIEQIKSRVDPLTWSAIDSLRKLGNIGAHMENDINLIVDVDPDEAKLLLGLIETLIDEWYVQREERRLRMEKIIAAAAAK